MAPATHAVERLTAPPRTATARLAVVIVNFCQWRNTARLVKQLRHADSARDGLAEVLVIDNGSPPHALAARLDKLPGVRVALNRRNLGFAKAVNRGAQLAEGDWLLLLNPDVTVDDGFLDQALALLDELPAGAPVGAVGLQLRHADGSPQASTGKFPSLARTLFGLLKPRSRRKCSHQSLVERDPVDWATGGCLLVNRDCFRNLGGFDERFFLYYEDVDFCKRAAAQGWQVLYDPRASVVHHWPLHRRAVPAPLRLITRHALLTYARQHWPKLACRLLGRTVALEAILRRMWAGFHGKRETAATYRDLGRLVTGLDRDPRSVEKIVERAAATLRATAAMQDHCDAA
jgi:GT2 family glycosyltransferase